MCWLHVEHGQGLLGGSWLPSSLPTHKLSDPKTSVWAAGNYSAAPEQPAQRWAAEVTWQNSLVNMGYQFIYKVSQLGPVNLFYYFVYFVEGDYVFLRTQSSKQFIFR